MRSSKGLPVAPFLSKQLLELSQRDNPSFDGCPVRDGLSAEVIGHNDILTGLLLHILMPANEQRGTLQIYQTFVLQWRGTKLCSFLFSNKLRSTMIPKRCLDQRRISKALVCALLGLKWGLVLVGVWGSVYCCQVKRIPEAWQMFLRKRKKTLAPTDVPLSSHPHQSFDVTKLHICIRSRHTSTAFHSPAADQRLTRQNDTALQPNLWETTY